MRVPTAVADLQETMQRLGWYAAIARLVILTAALVYLVTTAVAGRSNIFLTTLVVVVAVLAVAGPDSAAPLMLIITMLVVWLIEVRTASVGWSLILALCVLAVHAGAARAASLVERTPFNSATAGRWLAQIAAVAVMTAMLWGVVVLLNDSPAQGQLALSAAAFAAVLAVTLILVRRISQE